ncbi:MAG: 50S ribosomal protein L3 [Candidatus Omnitrophota bacterium]
MMGLIGKKIGMSQIFKEDGKIMPISIIEAGPCIILGLSEKKVKIGFGSVKEKNVKKPQLGIFKKLNTPPRKIIKEFIKDSQEYKIGQELTVDFFKQGDFVDVSGRSIGKGFQGGMKRWHWKGGPRTHGSTSKRRVGSVGSSATPSRVFRGHHMPGHMGNKQITVQNLEIIKVLPEKNIICVKGAIPGPKNHYVIVKRAKKK